MASRSNFSSTALDHARNPRNLGALGDSNGHARIAGPCGDTMEFWLQVRADRVHRAGFLTDGCGASTACCSVATTLAVGKPVEEVYVIESEDILTALDGLPEESRHCAVLAASTLRAACEDFLKSGRRQDDRPAAKPGSCARCQADSSSPETPSQHESDKVTAAQHRLEERLCRIKHKILVLSGKGGVGKSTVAANLAVSLARAGKKVGLLDIDVHGPSIPRLLGLTDRHVTGSEDGLQPVRVDDNLSVISVGFLVPGADAPVIWRGPMKHNAIRQFLRDVAWGRLDFLVVDSPPGTGDEPLSVVQLCGAGAEALIVTTPQDLAVADVRRCVSFCRKLSVPVLGILENMSGLTCPECGKKVNLFKAGGGRALAQETQVPFLGEIPLDPQIVTSGDSGAPFAQAEVQTPAGAAFAELVQAMLNERRDSDSSSQKQRRTLV